MNLVFNVCYYYVLYEFVLSLSLNFINSFVDIQDCQIQINTVFLRFDTLFCFVYISAPRYRTEDCLYSKRSYGCHLSFEICLSYVDCLQPEILSKHCGAFFLRHPVVRLYQLGQVCQVSYVSQVSQVSQVRLIRFGQVSQDGLVIVCAEFQLPSLARSG